MPLGDGATAHRHGDGWLLATAPAEPLDLAESPRTALQVAYRGVL